MRLSFGEVTVRGIDPLIPTNASSIQTPREMDVGFGGRGSLTIDAGASVRNRGGRIATNVNSIGDALVTGSGSTWTNTADLDVGLSGQGRLTIEAAGAVSNGAGRIATNVNSIGDALVAGSSSTWTNRNTLTVGQSGAGSLTVVQGGQVNAVRGVIIAQEAGSTGVLNIGAPEGAAPVMRGTLTTPSVTFGAGTGRLVFNHTDPRGNEYNFVPLIAGAGQVVVLGGTTELIANNTYTGGTTIGGGVLEIASNANLGDAAGPLAMSGGTLRTTANIGMARNTTLGGAGGTLDTQTFDADHECADHGDRRAHQDRRRHAGADRRQQLHGPHQHRRRHLAARQWRQHRQHRRRCSQPGLGAGLQPQQ